LKRERRPDGRRFFVLFESYTDSQKSFPDRSESAGKSVALGAVELLAKELNEHFGG
jgi:hypothetical protein